MVLKSTRLALLSMAVCLFLNGCTHLKQASDDNRIPESKVIPVNSEQLERIDNAQTSRIPSQSKQASETSQEIQSKPAPLDENTSNKTAAPKKSDVLDAILLQARKAIDNGQWLRAQHHLEHALRIAPQHAQTFYLYALVYQGLGVPDQATQMLKRALFLSKADSDLHQTVKQALDDLTQ